jgi:hypothetical protein
MISELIACSLKINTPYVRFLKHHPHKKLNSRPITNSNTQCCCTTSPAATEAAGEAGAEKAAAVGVAEEEASARPVC